MGEKQFRKYVKVCFGKSGVSVKVKTYTMSLNIALNQRWNEMPDAYECLLARLVGSDFDFKDTSARSNSAYLSKHKTCIARESVNRLDWLARSPDFSLILHTSYHNYIILQSVQLTTAPLKQYIMTENLLAIRCFRSEFQEFNDHIPTLPAFQNF